MKKVMFGLLILVLSSLVVAQGSEIVTNFNIGNTADVGRDYVPSASFWDVYGTYVIVLIIILIIVFIYLKSRCSSVKKVKKRRKVKRKK